MLIHANTAARNMRLKRIAANCRQVSTGVPRLSAWAVSAPGTSGLPVSLPLESPKVQGSPAMTKAGAPQRWLQEGSWDYQTPYSHTRMPRSRIPVSVSEVSPHQPDSSSSGTLRFAESAYR